MIGDNNFAFGTEKDKTGRPTRFINSLSYLIERHMRTSPQMFRPSSLQRDFLLECGVTVSRQAINSALATLVRQGSIVRRGRGLYCHQAHI